MLSSDLKYRPAVSLGTGDRTALSC